MHQAALLGQACRNARAVFHLASIAHVGTADESVLQHSIVEGTQQLAAAAKQAGVASFVYFSSSLAAAAGDRAASSYARCKKAAEESVLGLADQHFRVCVLRPVNVYGPGMKGNLAGLIRHIRAGRLPSLPRLSHRVPLVAVQDLCQAAILAAENPRSAGRIYTVTDSRCHTPNSIETAIYQALGKKKPGWHSPRVVFYLAAAAAQLANDLGLWRNNLGLRTYRNLTGQGAGAALYQDIGAASEQLAAELGYRPQRSFRDELPAILAAL